MSGSIWDKYQKRFDAHGDTKREAIMRRGERFIRQRAVESLSCHRVIIYPPEHAYNSEFNNLDDFGIEQDVLIIDTDNLNEKSIRTLPGDDIILGSVVLFKNHHWLVTELDVNSTMYTRCNIVQCNHLLKWISESHEIVEQWCVVEDGTKYLTGEIEDRYYFTTRGDSRISIQLSKNPETSALNRKSRFLIDNDDTPHKLAYQLTKPLKIGGVFNGVGTFKFVCQEVTATELDHQELGIANYYKHFPKQTVSGIVPPTPDRPDMDKQESASGETPKGKKVWI